MQAGTQNTERHMKTTNKPYEGFAQLHFRNGEIKAFGIEKSPYEIWETKEYMSLAKSLVMNFGLVSMIIFFDDRLESQFVYRNEPCL